MGFTGKIMLMLAGATALVIGKEIYESKKGKKGQQKQNNQKDKVTSGFEFVCACLALFVAVIFLIMVIISAQD